MKKNELYLLLEKILLDEKKNSFLVNYCFEEYNLLFTNTKITIVEKDQVNLFYNKLNEFFVDFIGEIVSYRKEIAYNYFKIFSNFFQYLKLSNRSEGYLNEYRIFAIRTMELALTLQRHNINARDLFFDKKKSHEFYYNLLNIFQIDYNSENNKNSYESKEVKIFEKTFKWKLDGLGIYTSDDIFIVIKSTVKAPWGTGKTEPSLREYLKLHYYGVYQVYNQISIEVKRKGKGGLGILLIPLDCFPKQIYTEGKIVWLNRKPENEGKNETILSVTDDKDELFERIAKANKRIKSLNDSTKLYGLADSVKKYNSFIEDESDNKSSEHEIKTPKKSSKYKQILLNKSIGHLSAKNNLYLPSKYNIPDIEMLRAFLSSISSKNSYEFKILIMTILLGIDTHWIISIILKLSEELKLINKKYLRVNLTTAYAQTRNEILFKNTKKYIEFELPILLINYFKQTGEILYEKLYKMIEEEKTFFDKEVTNTFYSCKTITNLLEFLVDQYGKIETERLMNEFVSNEVHQQKKYLQKNKKFFNKYIKIDSRTLHLYSFFFYKLQHKESDIAHLFLKKKTANIHTKLTYVASPTKVLSMTIWIEELARLLELEPNYTSTFDTDTQYSGTNKLILPNKYKEFLMILSKTSFENEYANLTLKMIYIRYVFCILLATRKYNFSCDLQQYSERKKLLFIHEKAKNTYSSKRIIPVTDLGSLYIKKFYRLKYEYNLYAFSPVIVDNDGNEKSMNHKNLMEWLQVYKNDIVNLWSMKEYEIIENFISKVVRDFGRHIFASEANNFRSIDQDYVDAFLNHFFRGTQDQGIYSSFDNREYFRQTRELMRSIEQKYIPYWKEVGI